MATKRLPVVVGIDVGYEFTKVTAAVPEKGKYPAQPRVLLWPSFTPVHALPTVISCSGATVAIGNELTNHDGRTFEVFPYFKLQALDPNTYGCMTKSSKGDSYKSASELLRVFLCRLYSEIRNNIGSLRLEITDRWNTIDIDFVFSVPSIVGTRGAQKLVAMAKECNFETIQGRHNVVDITITEPEAAAVYILHKQEAKMKRGETAMVLDIGGGTSDLSMISIAGNDKWKVDTNFIEPVSSSLFGGAHVDRTVWDLIEHYMLRHSQEAPVAASLAKLVTQSTKYYAAKIEMGQLEYSLKGFGISPSAERSGEFTSTEIPSSWRGKWNYIMFYSQTLGADEVLANRTLFARLVDELVFGTNNNGGIIGQAITMRDDLFARGPPRSEQDREAKDVPKSDNDELGRLDHVFFTGGLGGSRHLRKKVEEQLKASGDSVSKKLAVITKDTRFHQWDDRKPEEPQLCVANGLVLNRVQEILSDEDEGRFRFRPWLQSVFVRR